MVDVFEQVEEELRSDRYKRLARTWLPVVGAVLGVALAASLAWWGWDSWQTSKSEQASVAYQRGLESLDAGNPVGANAAFLEAEKKGNGAYRALALMQQAGIAVAQNQTAHAIELFDRAAKAAGDPIIGDAARLRALYLVMDTGSLEDVEARVAPLIGDKAPLRVFALEAQGMARLQHGKMQEAQEVFAALQYDVTAPESVRQRAQAALSQIRAGTAANLDDAVGEAAKLAAAAEAAARQGRSPTAASPTAASPAAAPAAAQ